MNESTSESALNLSSEDKSWIKSILLRISLLHLALSIAGISTGVIALYAALTQADATQKQLEASVLPDLVFVPSYEFRSEPRQFRFLAVNNGIGPARMRALRIKVDDKPMRDWSEFVGAMGLGQGRDYGQSQIAGRLVQPNETVTVFETSDPELADAISQKLSGVSVDSCYCSVFDQCWLPIRDVTDLPKPVDQCPDFGDEQFLQ